MAQAPRNHETLVNQAYYNQTAKIPASFWEPWVYLMAEALEFEWKNAQRRLRLLIETSFSVDGWGAQRLVEGMSHEHPQKNPPVAASIVAPTAAQPEAASIKDGEKDKRRSLLAGFRR